MNKYIIDSRLDLEIKFFTKITPKELSSVKLRTFEHGCGSWGAGVDSNAAAGSSVDKA